MLIHAYIHVGHNNLLMFILILFIIRSNREKKGNKIGGEKYNFLEFKETCFFFVFINHVWNFNNQAKKKIKINKLNIYNMYCFKVKLCDMCTVRFQ